MKFGKVPIITKSLLSSLENCHQLQTQINYYEVFAFTCALLEIDVGLEFLDDLALFLDDLSLLLDDVILPLKLLVKFLQETLRRCQEQKRHPVIAFLSVSGQVGFTDKTHHAKVVE